MINLTSNNLIQNFVFDFSSYKFGSMLLCITICHFPNLSHLSKWRFWIYCKFLWLILLNCLWWYTTPFTVLLYGSLWSLCFGAYVRAVTVSFLSNHASPESKHYKTSNTTGWKTGYIPQNIYRHPEWLKKALGKRACHQSCISQHHFQLRPQSQSASGKPLDCTDTSFE